MIRFLRLVHLRPVRFHVIRSALAVVSVGAGVALILAVLVVALSVRESLGALGQELAGTTPARIVGPVPVGGLQSADLRAVERVPGVESVIGARARVTVGVGSKSRETLEPVVVASLACEPDAATALCAPLASRPADAPPLISERLSDTLGRDGTVLTSAGSFPVSIAERSPILDSVLDGRLILVNEGSAASTFGAADRFDLGLVNPRAGTSVTDLRDALEEKGIRRIELLDADSAPVGSGAVVAVDLQLFAVLGIFTLGLGLMLMYNAASLAFEAQRRDLAVAAALGARPSELSGGIVAQAAVLGLIGGGVGVIGSLLLAGPVASALSDTTERLAGSSVHIHVPAIVLVVGPALGATASLAAAALPAGRAHRLDVVSELRASEIELEGRRQGSARRLAVFSALALSGMALCAYMYQRGGLEMTELVGAVLGLVLASVGFVLASAALATMLVRATAIIGRRMSSSLLTLSASSLARDPRRTAVTVGAVAIAVGIGFALQSERASIEAGLERDLLDVSSGDLHISVRSPVDPTLIDAKLPRALINDVRSHPAVERVAEEESILVGTGDSSFLAVRGLETLSGSPRWDAIEGTVSGHHLGNRRVFIGPDIARSRGLGVGSNLELDTADGPAKFTVSAVWADGRFNGRNVTMRLDDFRAAFGTFTSHTIHVGPRPGVQPSELARRLDPEIRSPGVRIETAERLLQRSVTEYEGQIAPYHVLQYGLLAVAFVAVASTLLLSSMQRQNEIAVLETIGMTPGQIRTSTVIEAASLGVLGLVVSVIPAVGITTAFHLVLALVVGFRNPISFQFESILLWGPVAVVISAAAALISVGVNAHAPTSLTIDPE